MPESSDNPPPAQKPASGTGKLPGGAEPVQALPRSARGSSSAEAGGGGGGSLPADTQISLSELMALARTLSASGLEGAEADAVRAVISRQQRKFSKSDPKAPGKPDEPDRPAEADKAGESREPSESPTEAENRREIERLTLPVNPSAAADAPTATASGLRDPSLPSMTARTRRTRSSARAPGLLVPAAIVLTLAFLASGVWYLARWAQPAAPPPPAAAAGAAPSVVPEPPPLSVDAKEMATVDKIMAAQRANDFPKALALCVLLRSQGSKLPGLSYMEAQLAATTNDFPAAAIAINRSLAANESVSACYMLRAAILARQGRPELGPKDYEAAAAADPFEPKPFFFWGEALRRSGQPQAALTRLGEAILRAKDEESANFYRFKQRLTLIELNRDAEFAEELKNQLALPEPPPDWLLTAAAQKLHRGDYGAAGGYLERASALLGSDQFVNRMRDFFFYAFAYEPALARYYALVLNPSGRAAAAPPAGADPAKPGASPAAGALPSPPPELTLPGAPGLR